MFMTHHCAGNYVLADRSVVSEENQSPLAEKEAAFNSNERSKTECPGPSIFHRDLCQFAMLAKPREFSIIVKLGEVTCHGVLLRQQVDQNELVHSHDEPLTITRRRRAMVHCESGPESPVGWMVLFGVASQFGSASVSSHSYS